VLAGCGAGGGGDRPALAADVGRLLEDETEDVSTALTAGDSAGARAQALELRAAVEREIAAGRVPQDLRRPLAAAVDRLVASLPAPPPPPPPPAPAEVDEEDENQNGKDENGGGKGKGKAKGKDKKGGEGDD
jgi:hypothetical protein